MSWGLAAQALASLGNYVVSFEGAAYLGVRQFGALATVLAVMYIFQAGTRAICGEVYVAAYSAAARGVGRREAMRAQAATVLAGGISAACLGLGGYALPMPEVVRDAALAGAVVIVPMLFWDGRKFVLLAQGRMRTVTLGNACVLLSQLLLGTVLWSQGWATPWTLLLTLALSSLVAILVTATDRLGILRPRSGVAWVREHLKLGGTFLLEALTVSVAPQSVLVLVTALAGLEATAAIRAAIVLLAPMTFLVQALSQQLVAEIARVEPSRRWRASLLAQCAAIGVAAVCAVALIAAPADLLRHVVGENAIIAKAALPGMAVYLAASLASLGPVALLRVAKAVRTLIRVRVVMLPLTFTVPVIIAQVTGSSETIAFSMGAVNATTVLLLTTGSLRLHASRRGEVNSQPDPTAGQLRAAATDPR